MTWRPGSALRGLTSIIATALLLAGMGCAGLQLQQDLDAASQAATAGNHEAAYRLYSSILQASPGNPDATAGRDRAARAIVDEIGTRSEQVAAEPGPRMPKLREALGLLDDAKRYDPTGTLAAPYQTRLQERVTALESELAARASRAQAEAQAGRIDAARQELAAIRADAPDFSGIGAVERQIGMASADREIRAIETALQRQDLPAGREALARLRELGVDPARTAQVEAEFREHELTILREQITGDVAANRYYRAFRSLSASGREAELPLLADTLRSEGGAFYAEQARMRLAEAQPERAYLEAVKGLELDRAAPGLFELHRDARDQVQAGLQVYIAVPTFGAPRQQPDLGAQFSDALISHLFRVLPYGIHIAEREKIDMVMREQGYAEAGNVLNVQLIVSGNVSLLKIDHTDNQQEALARVKMGEKVEANPAYEAALRAQAAASAAAANSNTKPKDIPLPSPTLTVPVYETVRYKKGTTEVKGFATVAARIFDTRKGSITYAQEFNAKYEVADDYQDSVDGADIQGDPKELPTDTEVSEALRNKLVGQLSDLITSQFEKRERAYLEEARYYLTRRERGRAMTPLAQGFLYGVQAGVGVDDPDYAALIDTIVDETERDFLTGVAAAEAPLPTGAP